MWARATTVLADRSLDQNIKVLQADSGPSKLRCDGTAGLAALLPGAGLLGSVEQQAPWIRPETAFATVQGVGAPPSGGGVASTCAQQHGQVRGVAVQPGA